MKKIYVLLLLFYFIQTGVAKKSNKVILITLDGYRWQELFKGADSALINDKRFVSEDMQELKDQFWRSTAIKRRETLMPFVWSVIKRHGVLLGNRNSGNNVNVTNGMHFSYPGYNEILTGAADDRNIHSNDKINNPNVSILEIANKIPVYKGKVLAFGSWDVFPFILNEKRSGLPVNAGYRHALTSRPNSTELYLNKLQDQTSGRWNSVRFDVFTHNYALEAIKKVKPDIVYISYGETDDYAHDGCYDQYLKSAHRTDAYIRELWEYVQSDPYYKGQTTFIVTTDHGRGDGVDGNHTWRHHGQEIINSDQTWILFFGNEVKPKGESTKPAQFYANQIASTLAKIMEIPFDKENAGKPLSDFLK